jgi:TRAP-type uncharacterized transport system fused permease subunit
LLLKGSYVDIALATIPTLLGILAMSVALIGYWLGPLRVWERVAAFAAGVLLIFPGWITDGLGLALLIAAGAPSWLARRRATRQS